MRLRLLVPLALLGCGALFPPPDATHEYACASGADCTDGFSCDGGFCVPLADAGPGDGGSDGGNGDH